MVYLLYEGTPNFLGDAMTKQCACCKKDLSIDNFHKYSFGLLGLQNECKECRKRYHRTSIGLAKEMLRHQRAISKKRQYTPPTYTAEDLHVWLIAQPAFNQLFKAWEISDYTKDIKPSIDRINDRISYRLDNIQLSTSKQNIQRYSNDTFNGTNTKHNHAVDMLDMDGNFIQRFHSVAAAARHLGVTCRINIHDVCNQKIQPQKRPDGTYRNYLRTHAYGYKWRYSTIPNINHEILS
jgi:hypothetical protein